MIKPAFFKHAELYEAERESGLPLRVAFAGLWTVADRAGRFRWKIDLKPDVLPYDDVDMIKVLESLEHYGFVTSYVVEGKRYGLIPSFGDHQTFHKTERGSTLPAPVAAPSVNGGSPVRHMADTVTGTVTGTSKQLVADATPEPPSVPPPAAPVRPSKAPAKKPDIAGAPDPSSSLSRLPKATVDAAHDRWIATIGGIDYGRLRKALLLVFNAQPLVYSGEQLARGVEAFHEAAASDGPRWRGKWTPEKFAAELHEWVRLGAIELVDEWGQPTERGRAAGIFA